VRVVPSRNTPTKVHPSFTLQPEKRTLFQIITLSRDTLAHKYGSFSKRYHFNI
jgi:hypothetical protein